jgi:hypothetical protein
MKKPHISKLIMWIGLSSVLMLVFYNTKDLFFGTKFSIKSAPDGATLTDTFLPISGVAKHASSLEINGRIVSVDPNGAFNDGALLSPGYNIIEIKQRDRFGKEQKKTLHLVAQPSSDLATATVIHYQ